MEIYTPQPDPLYEQYKKAVKDPSEALNFYKMLLNAELLILTDQASADQKKEFKPGDSLNLVKFENGMIPVFTNEDRVRDNNQMKKSIPYLAIQARSLFELTKGDQLILNPFSEPYKVLSKEEISGMLDGSIFQSVQKEKVAQNTQVKLSMPTDLTAQLVDEIREFGMKNELIDKIYFAKAEAVDSKAEPSLLIGLDIQQRDQAVISNFAELIQKHIKPDEKVSLILISKKNREMFDSLMPIFEVKTN